MTVRPGWRGRFYEDFQVGDVYRHPLGRTVTDADNTWFTLLTMNTAEAHFNVEAGKASEFGQSLVNSALTLAIASGQSVIDTTLNGIANLGWERVRLTHPVFVGDTLWSESLVLSKRESASRPAAGIVTIKTRCLNQHGDEVLSFVRTFLVHKKGAAPARSTFPTPKQPFIAVEERARERETSVERATGEGVDPSSLRGQALAPYPTGSGAAILGVPTVGSEKTSPKQGRRASGPWSRGEPVERRTKWEGEAGGERGDPFDSDSFNTVGARALSGACGANHWALRRPAAGEGTA